MMLLQACYPDEDPLATLPGMTSSAVTALQQAGMQALPQVQGRLRTSAGRAECLAALQRALQRPAAEACLQVSPQALFL